jgi:ribosomal protein uS11
MASFTAFALVLFGVLIARLWFLQVIGGGDYQERAEANRLRTVVTEAPRGAITDRTGAVIGWSTAGKMGFRGSRKGTAYAAQVVAQDACRQAMGHGLREVEVRLHGPGSGRESAVRAVQALGVEVTTIKDVTPIPHNGCRPPQARRV